MLKILFPGLVTTAIIGLAFAAGGSDPFTASATTATPRTAVLASATDVPDACGSETLGVVFSHGLLESHSADALGEAFAPDAACEIAFVRMTSLVAETDEVASIGIAKEQAELAAHIEALIGTTRSRNLRVYTDVQSTAYNSPHRYHALVRVERRPAAERSFASADWDLALD